MDRGIKNLPLGSRLDALLRDLDNSEDEVEDSFDYAEFARQRQVDSSDHESEPEEAQNLKVNLPKELPASAEAIKPPAEQLAEIPVLKSVSEAAPALKPAFEPPEPAEPAEPAEPSEPSEPAATRKTDETAEPTAPLTTNFGHSDETLRAEMYKELGMAPPSPSKTASQVNAKKPTKKAMLEMAQANQRYERQMDMEIGTKTKGTATVDSFIAMLDDTSDDRGNSSPPTSPTSPKTMAKPNMLLSSPPPVQRLASFVRRSVDHTANNDDSDLEIIPESAKQRTSKPLRQMLSFSRQGKPEASNKFPIQNLMFTLQDRLRKQTISTRAAKIKELQERGIEIRTEQETAKQNEEVESLLEREQRIADELRQIEKGDAEVAFDDSDVGEVADSDHDLELSGEAESGDESDGDAEDAEIEEEPEESVKRVAVLSDSEDEEPISRAVSPFGRPIGQLAQAQATQVIAEPNMDVLRRLQEQAKEIQAETGFHASDEAESEAESGAESEAENGVESDTPVISPLQEPDLSDLRDTTMSNSQEMSELRRRYERAHANDLVMPFVEEEAQESDDEWAGLGGRSDEDDGSDVEGLVDDAQVEVDEKQVQQLHLEKEKERDLELVNQLVDDVHGGWRRKRAGRGLLEGFSDEESDTETTARREARESRKRAKLLEDSTAVAKLAANQRTRAFIETMADDISFRPQRAVASKLDPASVQETLQFLQPDETHEAPEMPELAVALPRTTITVRTGRRLSSALQSTTTRAAQISGTTGGIKSVEIVRSLHAAAQPKPRRLKSLAPQEPARKAIVTTSKAADRLFQRNWS